MEVPATEAVSRCKSNFKWKRGKRILQVHQRNGILQRSRAEVNDFLTTKMSPSIFVAFERPQR